MQRYHTPRTSRIKLTTRQNKLTEQDTGKVMTAKTCKDALYKKDVYRVTNNKWHLERDTKIPELSWPGTTFIHRPASSQKKQLAKTHDKQWMSTYWHTRRKQFLPACRAKK